MVYLWFLWFLKMYVIMKIMLWNTNIHFFKNIDDNPNPLSENKKTTLFDETDYVETYHAMEELIKDGKFSIKTDRK